MRVSCARGCVLCAYQSSRATFGGGFVCPRWARFVRPFLGGFRPRFGWVFGLLFGCGFGGVWGCLFWGVLGWCVGVVGERERQRRTGKGERAQGRTATANGASVNGRTACPFSSVRQCYLFSVDNIAPMVGGILQPNGNRKTANSMCPLTITPTNFSPNTEHIRSVGGFGNLPNSGGEFRNRNHGFLL